MKPSLNIAHEIFDGELVVVNLESGKYYVMRREAADIFQLCLQHASAEEIVRCLTAAYSGDPARIATATLSYLAKLQAEGIVTLSPQRPSLPSPSLSKPSLAAFIEPEFEVHKDMQDLLMLDPIHEVDTAGWPVIKPQRD
jgi:hypothetical protein